PTDAHSDRSLWLHRSVSFSPEDWCEIGSRVPAILGVRVAPAGDEPRTGSNNSERVSTSGRSTNYGSGHLTRVFRDIGRISSLPFLLAHPSPIGAPAEREGSKTETEYGFAQGKKWFQLCFVWNSRGGRAGRVSFAKTRTPRSRELNGAGTFADTALLGRVDIEHSPR